MGATRNVTQSKIVANSCVSALRSSVNPQQHDPALSSITKSRHAAYPDKKDHGSAGLSKDYCQTICALSGVARFLGFIDFPCGTQILFESNVSNSHSGLSLWEKHEDSALVFTAANVLREVLRSDEDFFLKPPKIRLNHASGQEFHV